MKSVGILSLILAYYPGISLALWFWGATTSVVFRHRLDHILSSAGILLLSKHIGLTRPPAKCRVINMEQVCLKQCLNCIRLPASCSRSPLFSKITPPTHTHTPKMWTIRHFWVNSVLFFCMHVWGGSILKAYVGRGEVTHSSVYSCQTDWNVLMFPWWYNRKQSPSC